MLAGPTDCLSWWVALGRASLRGPSLWSRFRLSAVGRFRLLSVGGGPNLPSSGCRRERPVHSET